MKKELKSIVDEGFRPHALFIISEFASTRTSEMAKGATTKIITYKPQSGEIMGGKLIAQLCKFSSDSMTEAHDQN